MAGSDPAPLATRGCLAIEPTGAVHRRGLLQSPAFYGPLTLRVTIHAASAVTTGRRHRPRTDRDRHHRRRQARQAHAMIGIRDSAHRRLDTSRSDGSRRTRDCGCDRRSPRTMHPRILRTSKSPVTKPLIIFVRFDNHRKSPVKVASSSEMHTFSVQLSALRDSHSGPLMGRASSILVSELREYSFHLATNASKASSFDGAFGSTFSDSPQSAQNTTTR